MGTSSLLIVVWDGEESDPVAVGELRLVGSSVLEHQVAATVGGGIVADIPEAWSIMYRELERRKCLSDRLRGRVRGLCMWSVPTSVAVNTNSARL